MNTIEKLLSDYRKYLLSRSLAKKNHVPCLVKWVERFLRFAGDKAGHRFESVLDMFRTTLEERPGLKDWQIRQAIDAVIIYRYQFRNRRFPDAPGGRAPDHEQILARARQFARLKRYARSTRKSYLGWIRRFLRWLRQSGVTGSPAEEDVKGFLTHIAMKEGRSASARNQAFSALLFLCRNVLHVELKDMAANVRAKRHRSMPAVLSPGEVRRIIENVEPKYRLMVRLLYGTGMRKMELLRLRVKDIDFDYCHIIVRDGKGGKDRAVSLPAAVREELARHLDGVREIHERDCAAGHGEVRLPGLLSRKYPGAGREWGWQFAFPAERLSVDPEYGMLRRHHVYPGTFGAAYRRAVRRAGIRKHATVHTLRHSYATHMILQGADIREVQELLGHRNVETTMIDTHVVRELKGPSGNPLDVLEGSRRSNTALARGCAPGGTIRLN